MHYYWKCKSHGSGIIVLEEIEGGGYSLVQVCCALLSEVEVDGVCHDRPLALVAVCGGRSHGRAVCDGWLDSGCCDLYSSCG